METIESNMGRPNHGLPLRSASNEHLSELDESEIWNSCPESQMAMRKRSPGRQRVERNRGHSLPLNVPDWSRILMEENRRGKRGVQEEEEDELWNRIPPHEVVARRAKSRRMASFSLYEGVGRTLKGRDLCKVRNAVWEKMGFHD